MFRLIWLSVVVFLSTASAAVGQIAAEAPPAGQESALSILASALKSGQAKLDIRSGTHWVMSGQVDLPIQGGTTLSADEVNIYFDRDQLVATGNVVFTNPQGRVSAEKIEFDFKDGSAVFYVASGIMSLGATANIAEFGNQDPDIYIWGERIEKLSAKKYLITRGGFTACVQPTPRWEVTSKTITLNLDDYAVARGIVLRVKGVPLLYLPAIYYPLQEDQRSTGILMPTYGTSTLRGASISNAFYWAIGRSQDATFLHDWFTRTGSGMGAEYRYVGHGDSSGQARFYRFNQNETRFEEEKTTLPANTSYQIDAAVIENFGPLKARGSVAYFTDVVSQQLYHQDPYQRSQSRRAVAGGVSGVFGPASAGAYYSRAEQFSSTQKSFLTGSLPRANISVSPARLFRLPIYASLSSDYEFVENKELTGGVVTSDQSLARFDVMPALRIPLSRLSFLSVTTSAAYRQTRYSRSTVGTEWVGRQYFSLQSNVIGPVFSKIWDTPGSTYSERMKHVIEPAFSVDYVSEIKNQALIPTVASLDAIVGGAARLTYSLTNRWLVRPRAVDDLPTSARQFMSVGLQQTYYSNPAVSRVDTTYNSYLIRPNLVDLSPLMLTVSVSPTALISANTKVEYDVSGNGLQVIATGATIYAAGTSTSLNYSHQRATSAAKATTYLNSTTNTSFLRGRFTASYGLSWDIARAFIVGQNVSGTYLAQCCGVKAEFQNLNFAAASEFPIPTDRRFNVAFVLSGLGTFSNFFGFFGGQQ